MADKKSFVLYADYWEHIELLGMEQRGILLTAVMMYAAEDDLPEMDGMTMMAFSFIKKQMDRDREKYEAIIKKRSDSGRRGGRPPNKPKEANGFENKAKKANGFPEKQTKAKKPDTDNVNDNVTDIKTNSAKEVAELFEKVWKLYPQKRGKGQVSEANKRHLLDIGYDHLARAIDRYKADLEKEKWRKPQNGSTFFNSGYEDYLDDDYVPLATKPEKKTGFNNFEGRNYDMDSLERSLIGN